MKEMLEEAKRFGNIQPDLAARAQSFPEPLTCGDRGVSTGVENVGVAVSKLLVKENEDAGYEGDPILAGG